jgi:NAD-dependent histone deacetylase SIR2
LSKLTRKKKTKIEAHGSYRSAHCAWCKHVESVDRIKEAIFGGDEAVPAKCSACKSGVLKPNCVFFGEPLPARFWMERKLLHSVSVLLVLGTSLTVVRFFGEKKKHSKD